MKHKIRISVSAVLFLTLFLTALTWRTRLQEDLASRISPQILRFHVLADSNRSRDQSLKLGVRDQILTYINGNVPQTFTKFQLVRWISGHSSQIEALSESWLADQGYPEEVSLQLTRDYFPTKTYGDMVFPCGTYDALRVTIGRGAGRNWWCVLYPSLCLTSSTRVRIPDTSRKTLKSLLDQEDYQALESGNEPKIHVKSRLLEALMKH